MPQNGSIMFSLWYPIITGFSTGTSIQIQEHQFIESLGNICVYAMRLISCMNNITPGPVVSLFQVFSLRMGLTMSAENS